MLAKPQPLAVLKDSPHRVLQDEVGLEGACDRVHRVVCLSPSLDGRLSVLGLAISNSLGEPIFLSAQDRVGLGGVLHVEVDRDAACPAHGEPVHVNVYLEGGLCP